MNRAAILTITVCLLLASVAVLGDEDQAGDAEQLTPEQIDYMTERTPMRRTGAPEEIAAVVHYLSSPDCSFVTGQCHDASGGRATY